jgi:hypothetical protein
MLTGRMEMQRLLLDDIFCFDDVVCFLLMNSRENKLLENVECPV